MSTHHPRMRPSDDPSRFEGAIYMLMFVVVIAFLGFMWQLYSGSDIERIEPPPGPYKVRPQVEGSAQLAGGEEIAPVPREDYEGRRRHATGSREGRSRSGASPYFVSNGPYVAQLAALQSEASVGSAWRRLSSRAPRLFEEARLDVERVDLGPRGVYFRVRAGYFPDRTNAARFCERIRQMGQDCVVTAR